MAATGYSLAVLWLYAAREELVHSGIYSRALQIQIARYFITPTFFVFSIVLAVWSPLLAIGSWLFLFPINGAFEARISSVLPEAESRTATGPHRACGTSDGAETLAAVGILIAPACEAS